MRTQPSKYSKPKRTRLYQYGGELGIDLQSYVLNNPSFQPTAQPKKVSSPYTVKPATTQQPKNSGSLNVNYGYAATGIANALNSDQSYDDKVNDIGSSVAGAFGPQYAALAEVGVAASEELKGDKLNYESNVAGQFTDPWNQFKGNETAEDWIVSFINPVGSAWDKAGKEQEEAQKQKRAYNQKLYGQSRVNDAKAAGQASQTRYKATPYGRRGMKLEGLFRRNMCRDMTRSLF